MTNNGLGGTINHEFDELTESSWHGKQGCQIYVTYTQTHHNNPEIMTEISDYTYLDFFAFIEIIYKTS